jgi:UDP-glucose 4-epimerase
MTILLTGGCGYIGTHTAWALHQAGERAVVLDDLSEGRIGGPPANTPVIVGDAGDAALVARVMAEHRVTEIIHLAARRKVAESVADPLGCYRVNVAAMQALLGAAVRAGVQRLVFASTAAVYGSGAVVPTPEDATVDPVSPYGASKLMAERILADVSRATRLRHVVLRYFNVTGFDTERVPAGQACAPGEDTLLRAAAEAAHGRRPRLDILGTDWPTPDGTCIRDFVHVADVADANLAALWHLRRGGANLVANCGSGTGRSVREVVAAFATACGRPLPVRDAARRPGDLAVSIADTARIRATLGWRPRITSIERMARDALLVATLAAAPDGGADLETFAAANIDRAAYLQAYPDVAAAGVDPLAHWLAHGLDEGRMLAPALDVRQGAAVHTATGPGWLRFAWQGRAVAIRPRPAEPEAATASLAGDASDAAFVAFVDATIDRQAYREAYADVAAAGIDPARHWLERGMQEGRLLAPGTLVRHGPHADKTPGDGWQRFTWRGRPVAVLRDADPATDPVYAQILAQARHEPAILSVGLAALPNLRRFVATDLGAREWLGLVDEIGPDPDVVLLLPWLTLGGADKYAADLADALQAAGRRTVVLVTDQQPGAAAGWDRLAILAPYRHARVAFLRAHCGTPKVDPMMLALLLSAVRPRAVVVLNSRPGLEAVARFGRGLAQTMRLFCTYFSMGLEGQGNVSGRYMPRHTLPHAAALTDNAPMAATLERLFGGIPGPGVALLPPRVAPAPEALFEARLAARGAQATSRPARWAWVSRIEPWKGTGILAALARRRPDDAFDLYGPLEQPLGALGLDLPNIRHLGTLADVSEADFSAHDGYVFTSLVEGMPNIVLEMSQHAIPLVLADVGGLRDTLSDDAAMLVRHAVGPEDTAAAFDAALERLLAMPASRSDAMLRAARAQVLARHSPDAHARRVAALFGPP